MNFYVNYHLKFSNLPPLLFSPQEIAVKNTGPFLRYLTDQMHERVPSSVVIWYDSVLKNGSLNWQNELNDNNRQVVCLVTMD